MRHVNWFRVAAGVVVLLCIAVAAYSGNNGNNTQVRDGVVNVVGPPSPTTLTQYGVLVGAGSSAMQATAPGTTGQYLRSGNGAANPSFAQVAFSELSGGLNSLAQHGDLCAGSEAVRRNSGDSANECFTPATFPITALSQHGDLCAGLEAVRRNAGDSANECFTPGTVSSVALSLPAAVFDIAGSPVTGSGTLAVTFDNQSANTFLAGPASGSAAAPTFRAAHTTKAFATGMDVTGGATVYFWPALTDASEDRVKAPYPHAVTLDEVNCFASAAPGGSETATVVIGVGACASGLNYTTKATCAISGSSQTCTPSGTTAVAAGQCVAARLVKSATAATGTVNCVMRETIS